MYIMIFHPDNDNFKRYKLNRLDDEVEAMVAARLRAVREGCKNIVKFDQAPKATGSLGDYGFLD
jgi:hypothetical protein